MMSLPQFEKKNKDFPRIDYFMLHQSCVLRVNLQVTVPVLLFKPLKLYE